MKQGTGNSRMGSTKMEPRPRAIAPKVAGSIGQQKIGHSNVPQDATGRGYKAPMASSSTHKSGSQGRH